MHPMLNTAVKAARRAAGIINRASRNLDILSVTQKAANDFVSEVDREAEQAIIKVLLDAYPSHSILAEESGAAGNSEFQWVIDPLDGTHNFLHGFPHYAVSIALSHRGVITQAAVYDPVRNDLFTASRGHGAYLNDRRMRVSKRTRLQHSLLGTGFPYSQIEHLEAYSAMVRELTAKSTTLRRAGAAALDLAYVAAGRLDALWHLGLSPWDIAAGSLLVTEAGGMMGDLEGNDGYMAGGHVVAGAPKVFAQLIQTLAPHVTVPLKTARNV